MKWRIALVTAQMVLQGMIDTAANYNFAPVDQIAHAIFIRKTIALRTAILTTEKATEVGGGGAFFRSLSFQRLLRDVLGALFHLLYEKRQHLFTGCLALGLDPAG